MILLILILSTFTFNTLVHLLINTEYMFWIILKYFHLRNSLIEVFFNL